MKTEQVLEKMGDISPEYVEEAAPVKRRPARLVLSAAAAAAVLLAAGLVLRAKITPVSEDTAPGVPEDVTAGVETFPPADGAEDGAFPPGEPNGAEGGAFLPGEPNADHAFGYFGEFEPVTGDEAVRCATHVIKAEFVGDSDSELLFRPLSVIKGRLPDGASEGVYAVDFSGKSGPFGSAFEKGGRYLLVVQRNIGVLYPHDKYVLTYWAAEGENEWDSLCELAREAAKEPAPEYFGVPFTVSDDPEKVAEFAQNLFLIRVDAVLMQSPAVNAELCECTVLRSAKGELPSEAILLPVPRGAVSVGGEYAALLADASDTAPVYSLASPSASLFASDEAQSIPALSGLFN